MIDLKKALNLSCEIALAVGNLLLDKQKQVKIDVYKDRQDIVTNLDLEAEELIISQIEKSYPTHNIISEEKGLVDKKSKYTWYVDPLDGTKEYFRKIPSYNCSFCLFCSGEPLLSVVNIPYSNQLFSSARNMGAYLNNKKITVNKKKLKDSIIYAYPPRFKKSSKNLFSSAYINFKEISKHCYRLRYSSNENNSLCYLAMGSIEGVLNLSSPTKSIADLVPGAFIAKMAGAKISEPRKKQINFTKSKQLYIASNLQIHNKLRELIT
jgi:myo-inositol-1(or 4)-monophosphatase